MEGITEIICSTILRMTLLRLDDSISDVDCDPEAKQKFIILLVSLPNQA